MKQVTPSSKEEWLKLRANNVNSTEVSAIFGLSPYMTKFELWHQKRGGTVTEFQESDRMKWGSRLESAIATGVAEDKGWEVKPFKDYIYDPELRTGSSFDFKIINPEKALLEIKNVDSSMFSRGWEKDSSGNLEAPPHIEIQALWEMYHANMDKIYITALVGGNEVYVIERRMDEDSLSDLTREVGRFWESIDNNKEPKPDFIEDAKFISKLYSKTTPGKVVECRGNSEMNELTLHYKQISDEIKILEGKKDAIKAEILTKIGDSEKVLGDLFTITSGQVAETVVESFVKKSYRSFRINWKKL